MQGGSLQGRVLYEMKGGAGLESVQDRGVQLEERERGQGEQRGRGESKERGRVESEREREKGEGKGMVRKENREAYCSIAPA